MLATRPAKAEFNITLSWPDMDPNDIDAWVEDPGGNRVWFGQREAGPMRLDRDDRALANDTRLVNVRQIVTPLNQEVVTLRGIAPGEFTLNAQYCESRNTAAGEVSVSAVKVNPRAEVAECGQVTLQRRDDEATAVRLTLLPDGSVADIKTLPKSLVQGL